MNIYIDGSVIGNPGRGKAVVVVQPLLNPVSGKRYNGQTIVKELVGTVTSNAAEYEALVAALEYVEQKKPEWNGNKKQITIHTDSQLIAGHINKNWKVNKNKELVAKAKQKILDLKKENVHVTVEWISRTKNIAGQKIEAGEV